MSQIGPQNLFEILAESAQASFSTGAAAGSTATVINLPASVSAASGAYVGGILRFVSGALAGQEQTVSANTSTSFTVASAFSAAPAVGDAFVVLSKNTIQANVSENIAQWSGTAVAAPQGDNADGVSAVTSGVPLILARLTAWTGSAWTRLKLAASGALSVRDDATGATGAAVPTSAVQVGVSDGTLLRAARGLTDGTQVTSTAPQLANYVPGGTAVAATTPLLLNYGNAKSHYTVPSNGTINIAVSLSAAAVLSYANNAASASPVYNTLNNQGTSAQSLVANGGYAFSVPVKAGDVIDFEVSAGVTVNILDVHFVPSQ